VEEEIAFAPGVSLRYAIEARDGLDAPARRLRRRPPAPRRAPTPPPAAGITSDDTGIETEQPNGSAEPLRIVIEKDFACCTGRARTRTCTRTRSRRRSRGGETTIWGSGGSNEWVVSPYPARVVIRRTPGIHRDRANLDPAFAGMTTRGMT
jgi:hypothetical protein